MYFLSHANSREEYTSILSALAVKFLTRHRITLQKTDDLPDRESAQIGTEGVVPENAVFKVL